jgi:sortase B
VIFVNFILKSDYSEYRNATSDLSTMESNLSENPIDFESVKQQNTEVCGWIKVDGTDIDYPILQSGINTEEDYYLSHTLDGKKRTSGAIYIQQVNNKDFTDPNTVIYGHNMLNGTMFAQLKRFRNEDFFKQNRNIYIYTPKHIKEYEIFSAFVYDDRHIVNSFNFHIDESYQDFLNDCLKPRSFVKNVLENAEVTTKDKIITLSTCTGNETERYLVVAVLKDDKLTK